MIFNDWDMLRQNYEDGYNCLLNFDASMIKDGRYELQNGIYVNVDSYLTQSRESRRFEVHRNHIDIQYIVSGSELITIADVDGLIRETDYNAADDIIFYHNCFKGQDYYLTDGCFILIEAGLAHMPCISANGPRNVRKAVFKISV